VQGRFGFAGAALIWSTRERNSYCSPVSRLSRGFDIAASDSPPAGLVESRFDSPENQQIELQENRTKTPQILQLQNHQRDKWKNSINGLTIIHSQLAGTCFK
jgi:hypothetical protein